VPRNSVRLTSETATFASIVLVNCDEWERALAVFDLKLVGIARALGVLFGHG
jgi:hypothetical protein